MEQAKIFEGSWEELAKHADEFRAHPKLTLIVPDPNPPGASRYKADLTAEERIRQMDAFAETNRGLPSLPDEAFDRENLYGDNDR
jgi:hypothetical protein